MALTDWDPVAANNATVLGVNIGEGTTAPSSVNNALRQICADVAGGINLSLLATFLASTTLAQARSALGVTEGSASQTAFAALTNSANKVPYMTGSDAWSTFDATSFFRTLGAAGDAAAFRTLISAVGGASATAGTNTGTVSIPLTASFTLLIQWGSGSLAGNSSGSVTFGTAYSVAPFVVVNGGGNDTDEGDIHNVGAASTTGVTIANGAPSTDSYTWLSIGKA